MIKLDLHDHAKADLPEVQSVPSEVETADDNQVGGESLFKAIRGALAHNDRTDLRGFGVFLVRPRKKVERTMSLLSAVVQSSSEAIIAATLEGEILTWNPGAELLFGYSANEVVGGGLLILAVTEEHPDILRALKRVNRGENAQVEATGIRKDGRYVRISFGLSAIRGKDGEPIGVSATVHDITKQEMREERLRERAEHFNALVERTTDLISVVDSDGLIRYVNSAANSIIGYEPGELIRTSVFEHVHPDDHRILALALRGDAGSAHLVRVRFRARHLDGSWRTLEVNCRNLLSDEAVEGILVSARDVTERARDDDETQAKRSFKASQELAGAIAVDFLQLLGKIHAHSDRILRNLDGNEVLRTGAEEVKTAAGAASLLARQLLAFGRRQTLNPRVADLNSIVTDVQNMVAVLAGEKIKLVTSLDPELGRVRVDPHQIEELIVTLALNATDAMPEGGTLTIATKNVDSTDSLSDGRGGADRHVILVVQDSGCGIEPANQSRIFEPLFTTKAKTPGKGMGLSFVYGVVEQNNGEIALRSDPGAGTTFVIKFPRVEASCEVATHEAVAMSSIGTEAAHGD